MQNVENQNDLNIDCIIQKQHAKYRNNKKIKMLVEIMHKTRKQKQCRMQKTKITKM